jgi:hypothetical protein
MGLHFAGRADTRIPTHATATPSLTQCPGQKAGLCVRSISLSGRVSRGNLHGQIDLLSLAKNVSVFYSFDCESKNVCKEEHYG